MAALPSVGELVTASVDLAGKFIGRCCLVLRSVDCGVVVVVERNHGRICRWFGTVPVGQKDGDGSAMCR